MVNVLMFNASLVCSVVLVKIENQGIGSSLDN